MSSIGHTQRVVISHDLSEATTVSVQAVGWIREFVKGLGKGGCWDVGEMCDDVSRLRRDERFRVADPTDDFT